MRFYIEVVIGKREKSKYEHLQTKSWVRQVIFLFYARRRIGFNVLVVQNETRILVVDIIVTFWLQIPVAPFDFVSVALDHAVHGYQSCQ